MNAPIALLTDFGNEDWYVASMKGVLLSRGVASPLIDISHSISAGDIGTAAFVLANCYSTFPLGTVFIVVVDPGVGSARKPLAIKGGGYFFVGPDNGVFTYVINILSDCPIREIENFEKQKVSSTFHGRDIFAPCAAELALGKEFSQIGPEITHPVQLEVAKSQLQQGAIVGQIIYIDHFGNGITNISREDIKELNLSRISIQLPSGIEISMGETYSDVNKEVALCLFGSNGWLEVSLNGGGASNYLGLKVGDKVTVKGVL